MPKKKRKANLELPEHSGPCQAPGCRESGLYKAPKSKTAPGEYTWYCLDHIRDYNQKWDFFTGMNRDEIEAFMRDAVTGHRPTWNRETQAQRQYERLQQAMEEFMQLSASRTRKSSPLHPKLREALAVMDLDYPYTTATLKRRYHILVKQFHPDVNKGDRKAEEKFKTIAVAYLLLAEQLKNA